MDNDGVHGVRERSGYVALAAGKHPIELVFFQGRGGIGLSLLWDGPGFEKREVAPEALGEGIRRILTDPARARALAEAGRRLAEEEYGIEPYMQRLTAILERIPVPKAA